MLHFAEYALGFVVAFTPPPEISSADARSPALRVHSFRPKVQRALAKRAGWRRFLEREGAGWRAVFDESTSAPRTLWGRGPTLRVDSRAHVVQDVLGFLARHAEALGATDGTLSLRSARYNRSYSTWYIDVDVMRDGLTTTRPALSVRVKHGRVVMIQGAALGTWSVVGDWRISEAEAMAAAMDWRPAPTTLHTSLSAQRRLLERGRGASGALHRVWEVHSRTETPPGRWVIMVDAASGEVLSAQNRILSANGTVSALHHSRLSTDPLVTSLLPRVRVRGSHADGFNSDITDEDGIFMLDAGLNYTMYTTNFRGEYVYVSVASGTTGVLSGTEPDLLWTTEAATQAEIDVYVWVEQMRDWGLRVATGLRVLNRVRATVNHGRICNASYDPEGGSLLFGDSGVDLATGRECSNMGQIADVVYHEWGHGFHFDSILSGEYDFSLGEGAADVIAFLQTGDPRIAPGFIVGSSEGIRSADNNLRYPDDLIEGNYHANGRIFSGAMWDLWTQLRAEEGEVQGTRSFERILVGLLKGGPDLPGAFGEALVADDDDGDLDNGTPHECAILAAFGRHGLGPGLAETLATAHDPVVGALPSVDQPVAVELTPTDNCRAFDIAEANVRYRVDGADWQSVPLTATGRAASGAIPSSLAGSIVEYFIEGSSIDGVPFSVPESGIIRPLSYVVGDVLEIRCDNFDNDDDGYTTERVADGNGWQRARPDGRGLTPSESVSGEFVWGTNLTTGTGLYADSSTRALVSAPFEKAHYTGVFLEYQRFLTVEDGRKDQATVSVGAPDSWTPVWTNREGNGVDHHLDDGWTRHLVALADEGLPATLQIRFELVSDDEGAFGGWAVDDVCVKAPATANNRLGISDFAAVAQEQGGVALAWTNPRHAPLQAVRVVKRQDRFPRGADDGDVVYAEGMPMVGQAVSITDASQRGGVRFYAVYAFDGTDWLSFTMEGLNAAQVDIAEAPIPEDTGCQTSSQGGSSSLLLLLLGFWLYRRKTSPV